jgi:hypothetical protein
MKYFPPKHINYRFILNLLYYILYFCKRFSLNQWYFLGGGRSLIIGTSIAAINLIHNTL